ncbi:hypothetical protein GCM10008983_17150 [Lentibacillus halophilus]|uniref:GIY-YIG domain-containing protein n=1 Tax=Lentibacillus halophilus TaxID=295065 RepID=A0ABP3J3S6_9BACI
MEIVKEYLIQIQWNGPYTFEDLSSLQNEETDYGIYQIYGKHIVYGENALLYIGQSNQQTFGTRIKQHSYWFEDDFSIYVGRLSGSHTSTDDIWADDEINLAESLLINVHTPAYNTMNTNTINYSKLEHVHILNLGQYKNLLPELSGIKWITKLYHPDDIYRYIWEDK